MRTFMVFLLAALSLAALSAAGQTAPEDVTFGATVQALIDGSYGVGVAMVFVLIGRSLRAGGALAALLPVVTEAAPGVVPWGLAVVSGLATYGSAVLFLGQTPIVAVGTALSAAVPVIFGLLLRSESDVAAPVSVGSASGSRIGI